MVQSANEIDRADFKCSMWCFFDERPALADVSSCATTIFFILVIAEMYITVQINLVAGFGRH